MLVRFLTARTFKAHSFTYPLRSFHRELQRAGFTIHFHYSPHTSLSSLADCDVLCLLTEAFARRKLNPRPPEKLEFVKRARDRVKTLIWFDTSAGTGTTSFQVLPHVDLYGKNQVLRDRTQYTRSFYANSIYADFYHRALGLTEDCEVSSRVPASPEELHKFVVSWNLGLGDFTTFSDWGRRFRVLFRRSGYDVAVSPSGSERGIDVSCRASMKYRLKTISYQRLETRRQLQALAELGRYRIKYEGKLPYRAYRGELQRSSVVPSPFGLGEVCFRDFESFIAGAALLKPSMEHLATWPNYYEPDVTYRPHAWDFSDIQQELEDLLDNPDHRLQIARTGQERYVESVSATGAAAFAAHFASLMTAASV